MIIQKESIFWSQYLKKENYTFFNEQFINDFHGLIKYFQKEITGYYLCDLNNESIYVALSLSGIIIINFFY